MAKKIQTLATDSAVNRIAAALEAMAGAKTEESSGETLVGTAYAVFNRTENVLYFIRSLESHVQGTDEIVNSINGHAYNGMVFTGFEDAEYTRGQDVPWNSYDVRQVVFDDWVKPKSLAYWFAQGSIYDLRLEKLDTSLVTSMRSMFQGCNATYIDCSHFDTSAVTDMAYMFYGKSLKFIDGYEDFDVSNVVYMNHMFCTDSGSGSKTLKHLDLSKWDTSQVTNMRNMFNGMNALTSIVFGDGWNTSQVMNMSYMFNYCSALTTIDLSKFDTSQVTDMSHMFNYCSALTTIDLSKFDTSQVMNMSYMFNYCSALTTIYAGSTFVTAKVTSDLSMFTNCPKLVGGNGTKFSSSNTSKSYARIDTAETPGYFTQGK